LRTEAAAVVKALRAALATALAASLASGCAGTRIKAPPGSVVDDAEITSIVQARLVEDKALDAAAIRVETTHGNVVLSGPARSPLEKSTAEAIAIKVNGVRTVANNLAVRP
jgi:osmotically-inducible protein OsmY